ncbi:HAAS signaling domain-containing protein [Lentzea sp. CA-135723]|uniref:HAAS signaling domain-containing protein n=1 Tax=Lentzea sp. CA-135723 TaxID=3239950 RepID=UPI003D9173D7
MNTQALGVEHYLAGMRAALDDLPPHEVAEIMEDVEAHVAELSTELGDGETLEQRLGSPEQYAQELRQAAGYPSRTERLPVTTKNNWLTRPRAAAWGLVAATGITLLAGAAALREPAVLLLPGVILVLSLLLVHDRGPLQQEIMNLPETHRLKKWLTPEEGTPAERALTYLRSLQPAWWLARAGLLGLGAVLLAGRDILGFLAVAAIAVVSVFAGPRAKVDRRWLWVSLPASALAVGLLFQVIDVTANQLAYNTSRSSYTPPVMESYENIYAYDENGKLLTNVLLYDQDGRPINAPQSYDSCRNTNGPEPVIPANRYPRPKIDYENGVCYTVAPGVSAPSSTESTTPSTSSSTSGSATPSSVPPTSVSPSK